MASIAMLAGFTGCSSEPVYQTVYNHIRPNGTTGQSCVNACDADRQLCEQRSNAQMDRCNREADREFRRCQVEKREAYRYCVADLQRQYGNNWKIYESNCSNVYDPNSCAKSSCYRAGECDVTFNRCFIGCGGKIESETRCVRNCDNIKPVN